MSSTGSPCDGCFIGSHGSSQPAERRRTVRHASKSWAVSTRSVTRRPTKTEVERRLPDADQRGNGQVASELDPATGLDDLSTVPAFAGPTISSQTASRTDPIDTRHSANPMRRMMVTRMQQPATM